MLLAHQEFRVKKYSSPEIRKSELTLLERSSVTISLPAIPHFIANENFVVGTPEGAKIPIRCLGYNFKKYFLPKFENEETAAEVLAVNKLLESADASRIVRALGGEAQVEVSLGQFFTSFTDQPNGRRCPFLTNGSAIVSYARDIRNNLWEIYGLWFRGWCFGAIELDAGSTVIRRNPGDWVLSR